MSNEQLSMKTFVGTKTVRAKAMTRKEYNDLRGWVVPQDENPEDAGMLVEYTDGGKANHPDFQGYISWSPLDVFERAYQEKSLGEDNWKNPPVNEWKELSDKLVKLKAMLAKPHPSIQETDLKILQEQARIMGMYEEILLMRVERANQQ